MHRHTRVPACDDARSVWAEALSSGLDHSCRWTRAGGGGRELCRASGDDDTVAREPDHPQLAVAHVPVVANDRHAEGERLERIVDARQSLLGAEAARVQDCARATAWGKLDAASVGAGQWP